MTGTGEVIVRRAPGKLFLAGEYAVVESGEPAVLVAVDRFVTVEVRESRERGTIFSDQYGRLPLVWTREDDRVVVDPDHSPSDYAFSALAVVEQLVAERRLPPRFSDIRITSELDDVSGRKFGLGSSAAVTVATVRALGAFYGLNLSAQDVYKAAMLATVRVSPRASGGDVAASTFGGWIAYSAPDRDAVAAGFTADGVQASLSREWPGFTVRRLPDPAGLRLVVGWTGQPASTQRLVGSVHDRARDVRADYADFLGDSRRCVLALIEAFDRQDAGAILAAVSAARGVLAELSDRVGLQIETPTLRALCETATAAGAAAKTSGAGGGDCGIVLAPPDLDLHDLLREWEQNDIRHLDVHVHEGQEARP